MRVAGLLLLGAALLALLPRGVAAAAPATAVGPVPPGSAVSFSVREMDVRKVPAPGVTVTMAVAGGGQAAAVAPADRTGAAKGAAGSSAQSVTDRLGFAYFRLQAARASGTDTFSWNDGHGHNGQVVVTVSATATLSPTPTSVAVVAGAPTPLPSTASSASSAAGAISAAGGTTAPVAASTPWRPVVTGLAAVLVAATLLFVVPRVVRRIAARRARRRPA
jgi:hypothetical protein